MSDNSNAQVQQPVPPAPPAGPSMEELQARIADLEKAREGLIRDVQQERSKRQELETRFSSAPAPSAANNDVNSDELGKVLNPYIAPVAKEIQATKQELEAMRLEKAQNYLAQKTGKSWEKLETDRDFQEKLLNVARKYGVTGNVYDRTVRAYELLELEDMRIREQERQRQASAAAAGSMPSGTPPAPVSSGREYSVEEFNRMPLSEFDALSSKGGFRKVDNKFVYTPHA